MSLPLSSKPPLRPHAKPAAGCATHPQPALSEPGRMPPPPPPRKASFMYPLASSARPAAPPPLCHNVDSNAPVYENFRGGHHAANGHWNDAPSLLFQRALTPKPSTPVNLTFDSVDASSEAQNDAENTVAVDWTDQKVCMALYARVETMLQQCRDSLHSDISQRRVLEDTAKRLGQLYDRLAAAQVPATSLQDLSDFVSALDKSEFDEAAAIHVQLMQHDYETEGRWILGVKRLMELVKRSRGST